ncbi:MAG TPA: hypothetical protein VIF40_02230 [Methylosinus sp.]|uniref:hypothetical protein n=1 Tax=Methylosinus sp. TaxID=427 RepID=UPI002F9391F1
MRRPGESGASAHSGGLQNRARIAEGGFDAFRSIERLDQLLETVDRRRLEKPLRRQILLARLFDCAKDRPNMAQLIRQRLADRRLFGPVGGRGGELAPSRALLFMRWIGFLAHRGFHLCRFGAVVESSRTQDSQLFVFTQYFYADAGPFQFKMERALDTGDANAITVPRYPSIGGGAARFDGRRDVETTVMTASKSRG